MQDFLIPLLLGKEIGHPDEVTQLFAPVHRNNIAKAGLENAVWDLYAKENGIPLYKALGGAKSKVTVGVVIGIQPAIDETFSLIESYLASGYKRIKLKIKLGHDIEIVKAVRNRYPSLPLSVDANGAYCLSDFPLIREMSGYGLEMIEQPLAEGAFLDHAELQEYFETPICLDESISGVSDIENAIRLGSCGIFNIKICRLGGLTLAKRAHDLCQKKWLPVWCGGMFETGVGRAHNIALSTLDNFQLPGDISASSRYWESDIIEPEVVVERGEITVSNRPGIGYDVSREKLEKVTVNVITLTI
jgi:O-succinylbenzoate synthase